MHCGTMDIPTLKFPRDEIMEIIPAAYQNEARRIHIMGVDPKIVPGSPQDIRIPVPPGSGHMSPMTGLSSPAEPADKLAGDIVTRVPNTAGDAVADKANDED